MSKQFQREIPDCLPVVASEAGGGDLNHYPRLDPLEQRGRILHETVVSFGVRQDSVDALEPYHPEESVQVGRNQIDRHFNERDFPIVIDAQQFSRFYFFRQFGLDGQLGAGIDLKPDLRLAQPCPQFFYGGQDSGAAVCRENRRRMRGAHDAGNPVSSGKPCHLETLIRVLRAIVQTGQYVGMKVDHFQAFDRIDPAAIRVPPV